MVIQSQLSSEAWKMSGVLLVLRWGAYVGETQRNHLNYGKLAWELICHGGSRNLWEVGRVLVGLWGCIRLSRPLILLLGDTQTACLSLVQFWKTEWRPALLANDFRGWIVDLPLAILSSLEFVPFLGRSFICLTCATFWPRVPPFLWLHVCWFR